MKYLAFILIIISASVSYTSCTKDKAPNIVFDPNCSDTVSFSQDILPLFQDNCVACHDEGNSTGYTFTSYSNISAKSSEAIGAMRGEGFQLMPQDGPALPDSLIRMFNCWIQNGEPNN